MECVQGARAVHTSILEGFPDADARVSIVWIPMLDGDTETAARRSAARFGRDPRVRHFYDADRRVGIEIAQALGGGPQAVAWDIYLFFRAGSTWTQSFPNPIDWMHQLSTSDWAATQRYYAGNGLRQELHNAMSRLLVGTGDSWSEP